MQNPPHPQSSQPSLNQSTSCDSFPSPISLRPHPRFSDALKAMSFSGRKTHRKLPKIKIPGYGDEDDSTDDYFDRIMINASDAWWKARCQGEEYTPPWIRFPDE
jgi:hypothetical protein